MILHGIQETGALLFFWQVLQPIGFDGLRQLLQVFQSLMCQATSLLAHLMGKICSDCGPQLPWPGQDRLPKSNQDKGELA